MDVNTLKEQFLRVFPGKGELFVFYAPGRVNLIGEHTDYNGGYVFPCALSFGTYAVARKRRDNILRFASTNFDLKVTSSSEELIYDGAHHWANYPKGVIKMFQEEGLSVGGFDVLYHGSIPNGAGLSSSASIELATAVMLKGLFDLNIDMLDMVKLSQRAENRFVGVNCGIMDQFSIGMGKEGHAIWLNCRTLEYQHVPVKMNGYKLIITNTNKRRGLADSKYNERRRECERAVEYLKKELPINCLGEINVETFEKYKDLITDELVKKRACHVVYEDERTLKAVEKLKEGDIEAFGELLNESHKSLRDLYEVTGVELDTLAEEAWNIEGVLGSRMTGAGFGGCTVTVLREDVVDEFKDKVGRNYKDKTGLTPEFYIADIGGGAREIKE